MKTGYHILGIVLVGAAAGAADFTVHNADAFARLFPEGAQVRKLAGDMGFVEGPVWVKTDGGGHLIFSDIPRNKLLRWTAAGGVTDYREPSGNANGNTLDQEGRLLTAEHSGRRVARLESNGDLRTLVDSHQGKKLNSPNDVVVKSDGTVWFTDPDYGLGGKPKEQAGNYVYRLDPASGGVATVATDFDKPNGLCFSTDESKLYVADSGRPRHIRVFAVTDRGGLEDGKVFCKIDRGGPDGIRCDRDGRIWTSSGHGAQVFGPEGELLVTINLPESGANLCFGGATGTTLFVTARTSLYGVETRVSGASR